LAAGTHINANNSKEHNRKLLLRHILNTPVSRIEIASLTGLTRAGAGVIADSLIKDGILEEEVVKRSGKGRSPKALFIRDDALYAVGLNITRSGAAAGICALNGRIVITRSFPASSWRSREEALELFHLQIKDMLAESGVNAQRIIGAGITTPGPVDSASGRILAPPDFALWQYCPIAEIYGQKLGMPVCLENNAIARTIEEQYYGLGKSYEDFVNLVVDNGIGGGIVINNELIKGAGGCGSELGHMTINSQGRRCYCGNIGCLEMYANPRLFIAEARKAGYAVKTWGDIARRAREGDAFFEEMVKRMAYYVGCECTTLINLFEPQVIIISGELNRNSGLLIKHIQEHVDATRLNRAEGQVKILSSGTDRSGGLMAAATLVFSRYLSSPIK
jgi:predicted NBD/HSP70 family sugar kinase